MSRSLVLFASLLLPGVLAAQGPLTPGRTASGSITSSDPVMSADDPSHYDEWTFTAKARHRYRIAMNSEALDAYLAIGKGRGEAFDKIATDDDGGGGTNALLSFVAPSDGEYTVRANTIRESETGDYSITLTDAGEPAPLRPAPLALAQVITGTLNANDASGDDGKPTDYYKFTARSGRKYAVTMLSQAFDAAVDLGRGANGGFEKLRGDDDGAGGTNARLEWVATTTGEVWIAAHAINSDSGRYTLFLEDLGDAPPPAPATFLKSGATIQGRLDPTDERGDHGYFDSYVIEGQADQVVVIRMDSDDFDPIVAIGQGDDGAWKELDKDDDGGLGTNAHLEFKLPESGRYVIHAYAVGRSGGAYTIKME